MLANAAIGEYRLLESLGAGGMGEVYRAIHSRIGRVVAVKILSGAEPGPGLAERFINEARIQAGLHHPHIAELYDFVEFDGRPCIIMEYVDGITLHDRIQRARGGMLLGTTARVFEKPYPVGAHVALMLKREGHEDERVEFEVRQSGNEFLAWQLRPKGRQ